MVQLRFRIEDAAAQSGLAALARASGDMTDLMDDIGRRLVSETDRRFETETAPDGTSWKPSRRAIETGGQTLTDKGRLRDSISHQVGPRSVAIGTNLIYAAVHQAGATIRPTSAKALKFRLPNGAFVTTKEVTIPARPFIGISDEGEAAIGELTLAWLDDVARGSGAGL
jgi:phage virion morphogenesis protein